MARSESQAEAMHPWTRHGHELRVWVQELPDASGHVLVFGDIADHCFVRIHSRCLYGESLRSDDCDCGAELDEAMDMIHAAGSGVLIYLEQGRGELIAKARGLHTGERLGVDTFASSRSFRAAAQSLLELELHSVRLLTNNPDKVQTLREAGIAVSMEPLHTGARS